MDDDFKGIFKLAEQVKAIQDQLVIQTLAVYEPEVNEILRLNIKNKARIERALDNLLEIAFDEKALKLYKMLCRHFYFIDAHAAVFYVQSYREVWDED